MRFSCDSCGAQYMISDDKVGPGGVKVRCKRCGQVVLVKPAPAEAPVVEPAPEAPAAAPPAPSPEATRSGETGLDAELGQAFENVFGGGSLAEQGGAGADAESTAEGKTETFPPPPAAPAAAPPAPAETEWYAAIDDAQVGPLLAAGLKARWEAGEVGPDTLVWSAGMADWTALSNVPELAQALAPVPRPQARGAAARAPEPAAPEPTRAPAPEPAAPSPASDTAWKPAAASALAALASQELKAMAEPEPEPPPSPGSLVDRMGLPEGGVDPTGMIPLHLRGVETTGETLLDPKPREEKVEKRESTEVRELRKSSSRNLWIAVMAMAVAVGGGGAWVYSEMFMRKPAPVAAAPAVAPAPAPAPTPVPAPAPAPVPAAVPAPPAVPASAAAAGATTAPAPAPAAVTPAPATPAETARAAEPAPEPEPEKPAKKEPPVRAASSAKAAKAAKPAPKAKPEPRRTARARAAEESAAPAPAPAPSRKPAGDPLLDVGGDDDLAKELSGAKKSKSVYIPPAPGSDLPERVSDPQIIEAVLSKKPALAACVADQKAADPSVAGTLMLRWGITPDGGVRDVKNLSSEYAKQPIVACITGVVKSLRFPKSRNGREVEGFPFKF